MLHAGAGGAIKHLDSLKARANALKREITALYYAQQDPRVTPLPKIIMLIALGYALSPVDLIPDFIPVLGYLDDLIILPGLIALSIRLIPADALAAARGRAEREPLDLTRNWLFGLAFILVWLAVLYLLARALIRLPAPPPS